MLLYMASTVYTDQHYSWLVEYRKLNINLLTFFLPISSKNAPSTISYF